MENSILKKRTFAVIVITIITMVMEIYFGITSHSMALTADGFHMGTHALALSITFCLCVLTLKYQEKTEKLNALGGYTSAILLGFTAIGIVYESIERFFKPLTISFEEAIMIAIIGLLDNMACIIVMGGHAHCDNSHFHCQCENNNEHDHSEDEENLNYKAAYLHILADAFTSVLAIGALIAGKYMGWVFLDPIIGVIGGFVIAKWSIDLIKSSTKILLDF